MHKNQIFSSYLLECLKNYVQVLVRRHYTIVVLYSQRNGVGIILI